MFSLEQFQSQQPFFPDKIVEALKPFSTIKEYGLFEESLLQCIIDITVCSQNRKLSDFNATYGVVQEIQKNAKSFAVSIAQSMQDFLTLLENLYKSNKLSDFQQEVRKIPNYKLVQSEIIKQFLNDIGQKINPKNVKKLHLKLKYLFKVPIAIVIYDFKKKQNIVCKKKLKDLRHIIFITFEEKIYLTFTDEDTNTTTGYAVVAQKTQFYSIYSTFQTKKSLALESDQQFCAHCLMNFMKQTKYTLCGQHLCCYTCIYIGSDDNCFYCTGQMVS